MIQTAPTAETHTSDLTAACLRSVQLRHEGKVVGTMPSAMFRGNLLGEMLRVLHSDRGIYTDNAGPWTRRTIEKYAVLAVKTVRATAESENRPLTEAVEKHLTTTVAECVNLCIAYGARLSPIVQKVIGCELPIRWTLEVDGEPHEFASHLDLLFRSGNGNLNLWDWKGREKAPTWHYLARNLQFGLYWLAVRYGEVLLNDEWIGFEEFPDCYWLHLNNLAPYAKAHTARGDDGQDQEFKKGDPRPMRTILMPCDFGPSKEAALIEELALRVRMIRAGHYPTNPDPEGCFLCDSQRYCPHFQEEMRP